MNGSDGFALRRPFRQFAPRFETLETRFCPAVSVVASGHTLLIQGDDTANRVSITDDGSGQVTAEISSPTAQSSLTALGIDTIQVNAGNGDDIVNYSLRGNLIQNLNLVVRLGSGNDRVDTSLLPDISSGRVNIDIAGTGRDFVSGRFGNIIDTTLTLRAQLGDGDSVFNDYLAGNITGHARARFLAIGGAGDNTVSLHAEGVRVDAGSQLDVDLRGGSGKDVTAFVSNGEMDGSLLLHAYGGTGSTRLAATTNVAPGSTGRVDADVRGDGTGDVVTFHVDDQSQQPADPVVPSTSGQLAWLQAVAEEDGQGICYHSPNVTTRAFAVDEVFRMV